MHHHDSPADSCAEQTPRRDADGIDRRGFLECMTWAGAGVLWSISGGILSSRALGEPAPSGKAGADFTFAQISDSHIGFSKPANTDVTATFREAIARLNALPQQPDFLLHTGDLSHLSEAAEFDTLEQVLKEAKTKDVFYVPGEHDILNDNGAQYRERFGKNTSGAGWHSFDHKGVHFIGLVNVASIKEGGLGVLGAEQIAWLEKDVAALSASTPVVAFAHIPLWTVYPQWGWGTDDAAQALGLLKRFGSVTVLNGHIHQAMQKIEGNVAFHTARSTAFPQPAPGSAPKPGPMVVPADKLRGVLGLSQVSYVEHNHALAVVDTPLT
ncbi:MAG: metallophosphoesterase [Verrucomicrobia bacterium]|nr:metallophosphoesterase [Verrucomicrobiota bacterium]